MTGWRFIGNCAVVYRKIIVLQCEFSLRVASESHLWETMVRADRRRLTSMRSWQIETGHLACRWSEVGQHVQFNPRWMRETSDNQSGYLPPAPDFSSHSPFWGSHLVLPMWQARIALKLKTICCRWLHSSTIWPTWIN